MVVDHAYPRHEAGASAQQGRPRTCYGEETVDMM